MQDVQDGRVQGIVCWKLDRLARNPVDGGAIIWALDQGKLKEIVTPTRTFTNTADDKFWMQLEFGMAKKYVDDLSVNIKRGFRRKLAEGGFPGKTPIGYLNDRLNKTVLRDPERFALVRRLWDLLLTGSYSVARIHEMATRDWGLRTPVSVKRGGRPLAASRVYELFSNPFYCGLIRRNGEVHRGKHEAMLTVKEFQKAQSILRRADRPKPQKHVYPYTGLIKCGECGGFLTAETHTKKSGLVFTYYRCTRRGKGCTQPYVNEREIEGQLATFVQGVSSSNAYCDWISERVREEEKEQRDLTAERQQSLKRRREFVARRLEVLADLRLKEEIRPEEYRLQYNRLLTELTELEADETSLSGDGNDVVEPAAAAFSVVNQAKFAFERGTAYEKRALIEILGLNPRLKDKKLLILHKKPFQLLLERSQSSVIWRWRELNPRLVNSCNTILQAYFV